MKLRYILNTGTVALAACLVMPAIAGEVRGTVADASETDALQAAEVRIEELNRRTTTARDGSYVFEDVPSRQLHCCCELHWR